MVVLLGIVGVSWMRVLVAETAWAREVCIGPFETAVIIIRDVGI